MKFQKWLRITTLNESLKDNYLNYILDKISSGDELTNKEKKFLDNISDINEDDIKDYTHLTSKESYSKINNLMTKGKNITFDIGNIRNKFIKDIEMVFDNDLVTIILDDNTKHNLEDNYSYNIYYNIEKDTYSLQTENEFFEKIPLKND